MRTWVRARAPNPPNPPRTLQGDQYVFDEEKLKASTELVSRVLKEQGPFDGLVGFSQVKAGACRPRTHNLSTKRYMSVSRMHRQCLYY